MIRPPPHPRPLPPKRRGEPFDPVRFWRDTSLALLVLVVAAVPLAISLGWAMRGAWGCYP